MSQSTPSNEMARLDGPQKLSGHHFTNVLQRIKGDAFEIDEIVNLLEKHPEKKKALFAEVDVLTADSQVLREIRSLKHAVLLLGINRIYDLLNRDVTGPELTLRRPA